MNKDIKNIWLFTTSKYISEDLYINVDNWISELNKLWINCIKNDIFYNNFFWSWWSWIERSFSLEQILSKELIAIICSQWWDTANEMLNNLNFELLKIKNTPIIWFSDNTVLINAISNINKTINYLWPDLIWSFWNNVTNYIITEFNDIIINKRNYTNLLNWRLIKPWFKYNWVLWWWNIRCFMKLYWTRFFPDLNWWILLIEEVNKDSLWFAGMLEYLIQLWIMEKINWIILGYCHNTKLFWNETLEELFIRKLKNFNHLFIYTTSSFWHKTNHSLFPIWLECNLDLLSNKLIYEW